MAFRLSNPLRLHYGPQGTTRLDDIGHCFSVTRTSEDGKHVISRASRSRWQADRSFDNLAGLPPACPICGRPPTGSICDPCRAEARFHEQENDQ